MWSRTNVSLKPNESPATSVVHASELVMAASAAAAAADADFQSADLLCVVVS